MPTRSYYFPKDFRHLEEILRAEDGGLPESVEIYFRERGLPPIPSEGSLSLFLGISTKTFFSVRLNPSKHYRSFKLRKKDGTFRTIETPRTYLKVIQWWILDNILNHAKIAENVFGFVAGRSAIQNAKYHIGAAHILNVDIEQFFPSITFNQVWQIFVDLGYNRSVSRMLAELTCLEGHVPQGAPTSPALANLVLKSLDAELSVLAESLDLKYSRYADDLTFSSASRIDRSFAHTVEVAVESAGFALKSAKTRFAGQGNRMEVTGVVINQVLQPSRSWRKKTRAQLHRLKKVPRLTRHDIQFMHGIRGMSAQFSDSPQMRSLGNIAATEIQKRSHTVIGLGAQPILPNGLTLRQAEALAALGERRTNGEIAFRLETTEAAVKKRLQEAFKKIDVDDRRKAELWARKNL